MKKNIYYKTVLRRRNVIKETLYAFFFGLCSIPRLLLEVFLRTNFGDRYFSFSTAILVAIALAFIPLGGAMSMTALSNLGYIKDYGILEFLAQYLSWYLFLAAFIAMSINRRREIKRLPSVYDFARFSLSAGRIDPAFLNYQPNGKRFSVRTIETIIEPGSCFLFGLFLWILQQPIGVIIVLSSIGYSLSYFAAYHDGDNFIMDKIDEMICNEEMTNVFVDGLDPNETRGVNFYGRRPADPEMRRRLVDQMIIDYDVAEVA